MPAEVCCPVLELRQYTLYPGQRDVLISLFDREFVDTQEAVGMRVVGQFRDLDDPDRFVWVRGFGDMPSRAEALGAFYGGPVWKQHRDAANATMIDSDDVLLLRPVDDQSGFPLPGLGDGGTVDAEPERPAPTADPPKSMIIATIYQLYDASEDEFVRFFEQSARRVLADAGAEPLAVLRSEPSENTFPALPVRAGENVFVWFARFTGQDEYVAHRDRLSRAAEWTDVVFAELSARLAAPPVQLRLAPTARSLLR